MLTVRHLRPLAGLLIVPIIVLSCGLDPAVRAPDDALTSTTAPEDLAESPQTTTGEVVTGDSSSTTADGADGADEGADTNAEDDVSQDNVSEEDAVSGPTLQGIIGGESVGDAYYPALGNTGYDVSHYDLALSVEVDGADQLTATATIDLTLSLIHI